LVAFCYLFEFILTAYSVSYLLYKEGRKPANTRSDFSHLPGRHFIEINLEDYYGVTKTSKPNGNRMKGDVGIKHFEERRSKQSGSIPA
jgi:hypothetical protein